MRMNGVGSHHTQGATTGCSEESRTDPSNWRAQTATAAGTARWAAAGVVLCALAACGGGGGGGGVAADSSGQSLAGDAARSAALAASGPATPWPGGTWTPPAASYGATLDTRLFVTVSDGAQMAVDVVYPSNADGTRATGPFPILLTQDPYSSAATAGNFFVQRGYIYATMRVRGTNASGGVFSFFSPRDGQDGADVVRWLAANYPNSTGIVGLHGTSWAGLDQMWTVNALGPGSPVKAMQASCMGSEFYRETYFNAGIPTQTMNFPGGFASLGGAAGAALGAMMESSQKSGGDIAYYRDFWKARSVVEIASAVAALNIPTLLWSSNGDIYAESSLNFYAYLQNASAGQPIYGPMNRSIAPTPRYQINISQGGHCAGEDQNVQLQWFETWLKGIDTGVTHTAMPIHAYEVLSNRWFSTSHYPVVPTYTKYYLDTNGTMSATVPTGAGQETLTWLQPDPTSTVQYDSPVFAGGGTLAGPMSASVFASSTTSNLELIATLQAVASTGTVTNLSQGAVLGSMVTTDPTRSWVDSNGIPVLPYGLYDIDRYVTAGTVKQYDFLISPRFIHIPAGSKLRVVFTTQTPSSKCGPSLGVDPCFTTLPQKLSLNGSVTTLYHGPTTPSSLNLPLLPANCWHYGDNPSAPTPSTPQWGPTDPTVPNAGSPCQL